jgi:hypothetical protein
MPSSSSVTRNEGMAKELSSVRAAAAVGSRFSRRQRPAWSQTNTEVLVNPVCSNGQAEVFRTNVNLGSSTLDIEAEGRAA